MAPDPKWPAEIPIPEATQEFLSPDTTKTTRIDFTDFFLRFRHAEDAHPHYKHLFSAHQQLCKLLIEHPAMKPNVDQTFSTPANSKNQVYFMWDFVIRTFQILAAKLKPQDPKSSPMYKEVLGRSMQAKMLITDESGMLTAMVGGSKNDTTAAFTQEIKNLAKTLDQFPSA